MKSYAGHIIGRLNLYAKTDGEEEGDTSGDDSENKLATRIIYYSQYDVSPYGFVDGIIILCFQVTKQLQGLQE